MSRLVPIPESSHLFTVTMGTGRQFEIEATFRTAWAKAEQLAFGDSVVRVERHAGVNHYTEERST